MITTFPLLAVQELAKFVLFAKTIGALNVNAVP
jgi:hypothetical protein